VLDGGLGPVAGRPSSSVGSLTPNGSVRTPYAAVSKGAFPSLARSCAWLSPRDTPRKDGCASLMTMVALERRDLDPAPQAPSDSMAMSTTNAAQRPPPRRNRSDTAAARMLGLYPERDPADPAAAWTEVPVVVVVGFGVDVPVNVGADPVALDLRVDVLCRARSRTCHDSRPRLLSDRTGDAGSGDPAAVLAVDPPSDGRTGDDAKCRRSGRGSSYAVDVNAIVSAFAPEVIACVKIRRQEGRHVAASGHPTRRVNALILSAPGGRLALQEARAGQPRRRSQPIRGERR